MTNENRNAIAANLMHAAATWLDRHSIDDGAVVVVSIWPTARLGVWLPGLPTIRTMQNVDDAAAELLEATGPVVANLMQALPPEVRLVAMHPGMHGLRLQLLVTPTDGHMALRLIDGSQAIELGCVQVEMEPV